MDSLPSNECKKVNDPSGLGREAPEFEKFMTPKALGYFPNWLLDALHFVDGSGRCGLQEGFLTQS